MEGNDSDCISETEMVPSAMTEEAEISILPSAGESFMSETSQTGTASLPIPTETSARSAVSPASNKSIEEIKWIESVLLRAKSKQNEPISVPEYGDIILENEQLESLLKEQLPDVVHSYMENPSKRHENCNVLLVSGSKKVPCHTEVLMAYAPSLREVFKENPMTLESEPMPKHHMNLPDANVLPLLIETLYNGCSKLNLEEATKLLEVSTKLGFQYLISRCVALCLGHLNVDNAVEMKILSITSTNQALSIALDEFIMRNLAGLVASPAFADLSLEQVNVHHSSIIPVKAIKVMPKPVEPHKWRPTAMEIALKQPHILEAIAIHLPFPDLKKARGVSTTWIDGMKFVFKARLIPRCAEWNDGQGLPDFLEVESTFNQELVAEVPLRLEVRGAETLLELLTKKTLLGRIRYLFLDSLSSCFLTRCVPFILSQLSALDGLEVWDFDGGELYPGSRNLHIPKVDENVNFSISQFKLATCSFGYMEHGFLRHCKRLKVFAIDTLSPTCFASFFEEWNKYRLPFMKYEDIRIRFDIDKTDDIPFFRVEDDFRAAIAFINMNQPKVLLLDGFEAFRPDDFGLWTATMSMIQGKSIRKLEHPFHLKSNPYQLRLDWKLQDLKRCSAFAQVTHVVFTDKGEDLLTNSENHQPIWHNLDNVSTFELRLIRCKTANQLSYLCEKVAAQLQNVTSMILAGIRLQSGDFLSVFQQLEKFESLQKLSFATSSDENTIVEEKLRLAREQKSFQGYLKDLDKLTGLKALEVKVPPSENENFYLVALFNGYTPHVKLDLEIHRNPTGNYSYDWRYTEHQASFTYSVDEFHAALTAQQASLQCFKF